MEEAGRDTSGSFGLLLVSQFLTRLGDALASPKTTLAWMITIVAAPHWVLGFLVPLRESGSMVPQLFIGGIVRALPLRKWIWVAGSVAQCVCVAAIGVVAMRLEGRTAGWYVLGLIAAFSLARGFCSVASKDVLGKTVPKRRRGRLNGWSASAAGLAGVGVGVLLMLPSADAFDATTLGRLLVAAGALWLIAAAVYARVPEPAGETGAGRGATEALRGLSILWTDKPFLRFVATRALLMCSALSAPFYVALAQKNFGSPAYLLGAFVAAAGIAGVVSAPLWGRFADISSRRVMVVAAVITSGIGLTTFVVDRFVPALAQSAWFLPLAYFVLSVAHNGVRIGRKTYVIDLASGNQRTDYVAISNTVIGVLLLAVGSIGALTPLITAAGVIGLLALMGFAGALLGTTMRDA